MHQGPFPTHLVPDPAVTTGFVRQQSAQNASSISSVAEQIKARDASQNVTWTLPTTKPMKTREEIESKLADFEHWLEVDAQRFEPDADRATPLNAAAAEALRWALGREATLEP